MRRAWLGRLPEVAIVLIASALTTLGLTTPDELYFDEIYYVAEARGLLDPATATRISVHPPVGTWLIAAGIGLIGDTPFGWRAVGALAGVLTVWLTYRLVLTLTGRRAPALLAALLLVLDGAFLTQARIAMLDVYLVLFIVLGAWLLLLDRRRRTAPEADAAPGNPWALGGAGLALGLAVATKWSGAYALAVVGLLALGWEMAARRRRREQPTWRAAVLVALCLGVLPMVVYTASWAPWLMSSQAGADRFEATGPGGVLVEHHRELLDFHLGLEPTHRYRASATTWPVQSRPVVFRWDPCDSDGFDRDGRPCDEPGTARQILALGNVGLWWVGLVALPLLAGSVARRDWRAVTLFALLAGQYLPWLLTGMPVFSFYAVVLSPFLAAAIALVTTDLEAPRRWRGLVLGVVLGGGVGAVPSMLRAVSFEAGVLWALTGMLVGAAIGAVRDRGHEPVPAPARPLGAVLRIGVALLATGLFVHFAPVWFGIPMDLEAIERRWWFDAWT